MNPPVSPRESTRRALELYRTSIGKKAMMAASGAVWFGYVLGHLLGNLKIYAGPQAINRYAAFLHGTPALLWGTRLLLVAALAAHVTASIQLALLNLEARPVPYTRTDHIATTYAARTMVYSGPLLLLFIVYHLLHLTFGVTPGYAFSEHDVYDNVVQGFRIWWLSGVYIAAQCFLGLHLYHGVWSAFQTVGANHPRYNLWRRSFAAAITAAIIAGYVSIPISVMAGILKPTTEVAAARP